MIVAHGNGGYCDQIDADETPLLAIGQKPLKLAAQLARMTFNSFEVSPSFRATFEDGSSRVLLGGEPTSGTLANQALALVPLAVPKGFVAKPGAAPTPRQQLTTQATATADPSDLAQFTSQIDVFPSKTVVGHGTVVRPSTRVDNPVLTRRSNQGDNGLAESPVAPGCTVAAFAGRRSTRIVATRRRLSARFCFLPPAWTVGPLRRIGRQEIQGWRSRR